MLADTCYNPSATQQVTSSWQRPQHTQRKLTQEWEGLWRDLVHQQALSEACHDDVRDKAEHNAAHTQEGPVLNDKNDLDRGPRGQQWDMGGRM